MGAPRRSPRSGRHSRTVPLPSRSLSAPAGGILLKPRAWFSFHALRAYPLRARVGGGSAERAEGRSAGAARAGKRARRSGAQPGALMK